MSSTSNAENLADTIEQMREKYRVEREKRLRPDGSDQFIEVKDKFSYFGKDPFVKEVANREPRNSKAEVVARLNFLAKQLPDFDTSGL